MKPAPTIGSLPNLTVFFPNIPKTPPPENEKKLLFQIFKMVSMNQLIIKRIYEQQIERIDVRDLKKIKMCPEIEDGGLIIYLVKESFNIAELRTAIHHI